MASTLPTLNAASPWDADDTTYHTFTNDTDNESQGYAMDNVPANFDNMVNDTTFTVVANLRDTPPGTGPDTYSLEIYIANGSTMLAGNTSTLAAGQGVGTVTGTGDQTFGPTAFNYVNTTASKSDWDGATVYLIQRYVKDKGGDANAIQADYVAIDGTYNILFKPRIMFF